MSGKAKITREFFEKNPRVVIRPETEGEAIHIQKLLNTMDIKWCNGDAVGKHAARCVSDAMIVEDFQLYTNPSRKPAVTLPVSALMNGVTAYDLMSEPEKLRHDFNILSGKVDMLTNQIGRVLELLEARQLPTIPAKPRMDKAVP